MVRVWRLAAIVITFEGGTEALERLLLAALILRAMLAGKVLSVRAIPRP